MLVWQDFFWTGGGTIAELSQMLLPVFFLMLCAVSLIQGINAYDAFVKGVKDGMKLTVSIFPSLMAMILLINLLDCAELFDLLSDMISPMISFLPSEILAMCCFRPISGGASMALMVQILRTFGADSLYGTMASVIQGSTDTTLYVIALYFSSVGIKKIKNALWIGLFADFVGIVAAIFLTVHFF